MFENLIKFCDSFLEYGAPGYDIAVYKDGECVLRHMNGYRDLENKISMNGTERYNIYSCSKVITCVAAMQLWEKRQFSLEDELSKYLPEFANMLVCTENGLKRAEKPILIRHLFEMTAGFSYATSSASILQCRQDTDGRCPTREVMRYLAKEPLLFEPGDRWEYSLCHDVLAALVEVLSGERFEDYVQKHIFDVVGMYDSSFLLPEDEHTSITEVYRYEGGINVKTGREIIPYKLGCEYASGGAGGISTVHDCICFLEGLRKGILLKPETVKMMQTDRLTEQQKRTYWIKDTHGYGLGVRCPKENKIYTDFGWGGAAGAYLALDIENGISLYFAMSQLQSPVHGLRTMLFRFVKAELLGNENIQSIDEELKKLYDYHLTY